MKKLLTIIGITILTMSFGIFNVKADTFTTKEARWFYDVNGTENVTSWQTIPYTQNFNWPVTQGQYRLKTTSGFSADSSYKFKISYLPGTDSIHAEDIWFSDIDGNRADKTCTGFVRESNGYYANTCIVEPQFNIASTAYLYVRIVFAGGGGYVGSMRSYVGEYQTAIGTAGAINSQTVIINNELEEIEDILTEGDFNTNPSEELEGQEEIEDYTQAQESLMNGLVFNPQNLINVTLDANTNNYIWGIVEQLRGINTKIVLLMTSLLSIGVIKMILNR